MRYTVYVLILMYLAQPLMAGDEMLYGRLECQKWYPEVDSETVCKKVQSGNVFRFEVKKNGKESWHPILMATRQTFVAGRVYTFSIRAKSDVRREIGIGIRRDEGNYGTLGFYAVVPLTTQWQTFSYAFTPKESCGNARFDIGGLKPGIYEFTASTLKALPSSELPVTRQD
ncbi:hypothetical protein FACS1894170_13120 [Planctomycetales bacterium]|nr:hypothetical protein FACS1894170_13120 [Planctomycetales bacterium]